MCNGLCRRAPQAACVCSAALPVAALVSPSRHGETRPARCSDTRSTVAQEAPCQHPSSTSLLTLTVHSLAYLCNGLVLA